LTLLKKTLSLSKLSYISKWFTPIDLRAIVINIVKEVEYRTEYRNVTTVYLLHLLSPQRVPLRAPVRLINSVAVQQVLELLYTLMENKKLFNKKLS
jgi:hypothetical protein